MDFLFYARIFSLLGGLAVAGYYDVKLREVPDRIWFAMGGLGALFLLLSDAHMGLGFLAVDTVAVLFVMEHFLPWEDHLGDHEELSVPIEAAMYLGVIAFSVYGYLSLPGLVTTQFLAIVVSVLLARALFEIRLLYGGADAKALIASTLLLPLIAGPLPFLIRYPNYFALTILPYVPFSFTMLINGALLTMAVPALILARNLRHGFHELPDAFFIYEIPTRELPARFVWLRRPPAQGDENVESAEEDLELRRKEATRLEETGVDRVFVTPQIPMVAALAGGAALSLLFGNLLFLIF